MRWVFAAMANVASRTRRFSPALALCLAVIGAASMVYYHEGRMMPRVALTQQARDLANGYSFGNDFYQVWITARALEQHRRDLYSLQMTREIQIGLYGRPLDHNRKGDPVDQRMFPYPAFTDLLFWPTAEVSFEYVRVWAVCLLVALTCGGVLLWFRALDWSPGWQWMAVACLLTLTSYPGLEGLYAAQLGLLVMFLLAASMLALRCNRLLLAGFMLALTTMKPQVTGLAILYLFLWSLHDWQTRGRFCVGFFATEAVLIGASLAVMPGWILSWLRTVAAYHGYTSPPLVTQVLTKPLGPHLAGPATVFLTVASILLAIVLAWRKRRAAAGSFAFVITVGILLAITIIAILPGQAIYDHVILLPGILLVLRYRRGFAEAGGAARALLRIGWLTLFWSWIAAFLLVALRPWIPPAYFDSVPVFTLPLRAAAPLPFVMLALLIRMWRIGGITNPKLA